MIAPVGLLGLFGSSDHLGINVEFPGQFDYPGSGFGQAENFKPVAHIVNLVHFLIGRSGGALDFLEKSRDGKKIVLHVMDLCAKAQAFGLPSARTVHEAKNVLVEFFNDPLDHGQVGPGRTEQRFPDRKSRLRQGIRHAVRSAVNVLTVGLRIECLWVLIPVMG